MVDLIGPYGSGEYGAGPYGSAYPPFGIESATALTNTLVRVRYTALFDAAFPPLLSVSNYSISPALTILAVALESAQTVLLTTNPQNQVVYTVTVQEALGYFGQPLDPNLDEAMFQGILALPSFIAIATSKTRVRAFFSEVMLQNPSLTDTSQYVLTDLNNNPIPILSVVQEQATDVRSTVLLLGADLTDERHYRLTLLNGIVSEWTLTPVNPDTSVFQFVSNPLTQSIPVNLFSGEVQNGLYGIHGGLVFFSPALVNSAANSIIQVEEVTVCTKAYDEYHFPQPLDPPVLFTHGAGVTPTPGVTTLNSTAALWAKFPRLVEARFEIGFLPSDTVEPPQDTSVSIVMSEQWDLSYVSLLNSTSWRTFDSDTPYTGATCSIAAFAVDEWTLTGLAGMTTNSEGGFLKLSGADSPGNNGTFRITAFLAANSVRIFNPFGVAPDVNNGAIVWTKPPAFITANNLAPIPPGAASVTTVLWQAMRGGSTFVADATVL